MKKLLNLLLLAAVMTALSVPAMAAESGIRVADVTVQETDLVSIPVALQTETTGTAMSLTYTYDSTVLEIVPEDCRWIPSGAIRDFSKTGPQAVWASSGEKKLSGDLCVLTFRILNRETFRKTEVSCSDRKFLVVSISDVHRWMISPVLFFMCQEKGSRSI